MGTTFRFPKKPQNTPKVELVASPPEPEETTRVTLETKRHLPILAEDSTDLDLEYLKLSKLPDNLRCNSCLISTECPQYEEGSVCTLGDAFKAIPVKDEKSVAALLREVVERNMTRYRQAVIQEQQVFRGVPHKDNTKLSEVLVNQLRVLMELNAPSRKATVEVVGRERGNGVLQRLFAAPSSDLVDLPLQAVDPSQEPINLESEGIKVTTAEKASRRDAPHFAGDSE